MYTDPKQPKLDFQQVTKAEMNRLEASYIVEEMLSISTVESLCLRNILNEMQITGDRRPPSSDTKTFASYLDQCYAKMESELRKEFERLDYVCYH